MSEYQYYEWQAIDRALSEDEVKQVRSLSSHMDVVTATQAIVTYHWSSFGHNSAQVLLRYFDAMLYWANWGSQRLMFRFPKGSINPERVQAYCLNDGIVLTEAGDYYLLDINLPEEESTTWIEEPECLGPLIPLRQQIIDGDYRALYLAWLKGVELGFASDDLEPPIPPGMKELNGSLRAFRRIFKVPPWLVQAAAAISDPLQPVADEALVGSLAQLTLEECQAYLLRVLRNEPQVRAALRKQLCELAGLEPAVHRAHRSAADLLDEAERLQQEDQRRKREAAERKRIQEIDELAQQEDSVWRQVEDLIERKQPKPYDVAVSLLTRLRDLAIYQNKLPAFAARVAEIKKRYGRLPSLMKRFDRAGL